MCRHTILVKDYKKGALQDNTKQHIVFIDKYIAVPEMDSLAYVCIRLIQKYTFM